MRILTYSMLQRYYEVEDKKICYDEIRTVHFIQGSYLLVLLFRYTGIFFLPRFRSEFLYERLSFFHGGYIVHIEHIAIKFHDAPCACVQVFCKV